MDEGFESRRVKISLWVLLCDLMASYDVIILYVKAFFLHISTPTCMSAH
jgi:hypothetical protein